MKYKKIYEITEFETFLHKYRGKLHFGDAYEIIEILKGKDPMGTLEDLNPIDKLHPFKTWSIITFNHSGGSWTPIYVSHKDPKKYPDAYYIETSYSHIIPYLDTFTAGNKNHINTLNTIIKTSLGNDEGAEDKPLVEQDWNGGCEFRIPSGKILFMGTDDKVPFFTKGKKIEIDYKNTSKEKIFETLEELSWGEKYKFVNFENSLESTSLDFQSSQVSFKANIGGSHLIYKVYALEKNVDWIHNYFIEYYCASLTNKKIVNALKESVVNYVKDHGFVIGYYFVPENILDLNE